jgi:hypothetical protein
MKITKRQLRRIIKEEITRLNESNLQRGEIGHRGDDLASDAPGVLSIRYLSGGTAFFIGGKSIRNRGTQAMIGASWEEMTGAFKPKEFRTAAVSIGATHVLDQQFQEDGADEFYYPIPVEEYIRLQER